MSDPFLNHMEWRDEMANDALGEAVCGECGEIKEYCECYWFDDSLAEQLRAEDELDEARDVLKELEERNARD